MHKWARPNINNDKGKMILRPADWCVVIALFCALLILVGGPLRNNTIVSLGSRILIIATFGFAILDALVARLHTKSHNIFYLVLLVATVLVSIALSGMSNLFGYLVNLVCFFMLPVYLLFFKTVYNRTFVKKSIYVFNWICTILWTILFFSPYAYYFEGTYGPEIIDALTLGYDNANQTSMYLMVSIFISLTALYRDTSNGAKLMGILQIAWTTVMLWLSGSRTCIIITLFVFAICLLRQVNKVGKKWTNFAFFLPLIMIIVNLLGDKILAGVTILGESFGIGRTNMTINLFNSLNPTSFFLGNYDEYIGGNLHNSYLTIFAIFGIVGFLAHHVFLRSTVKDYYTQLNKSNKSNCMAYWGILGVIAHGIAEATFITSGMIYSLMVGLILVLTLDEEKNT